MKELQFCNQSFILHPAGILIWPSENIAIVADLHLEKASYYAKQGQFLPPHDSSEILQNLQRDLEFTHVNTVVLLGDTFHDEGGYHRLDSHCKKLFEELSKKYDIIWIIGNHDGAFIPPKTSGYDELKINSVIFRHEAIAQDSNEISGHYHPKATLKLKGQKISRSCFIEDGSKIILPAYGVLTGGLNVLSAPLNDIVKEKFQVHLLGPKDIYSISSEKLKLYAQT